MKMNLRHVVCTGLVLALPAHLFAPAAALASTQGPKPRRLAPVRIQEVVIQDDFWSPKLKVWREVTLRDCLAKFEKDGALANFDKIRDGTGGDHGGPPWYDGLIYEMIRGWRRFSGFRTRPGAGDAPRWLYRAHRRRGDQGPRRLPQHLHPVEGAGTSLGLERRQR